VTFKIFFKVLIFENVVVTVYSLTTIKLKPSNYRTLNIWYNRSDNNFCADVSYDPPN